MARCNVAILGAIAFAGVLVFAATGCAQMAAKTSWYEKYNWKAAEFFDDEQVIALCEAIQKDDVEKVERLIKAGVDVKAKGKGNMTPLLWAFPNNKESIFLKLLEAGADANVIVDSDFNTRFQAVRPGDSVTHMAAKSTFPKLFDYVMEHGGDPNLVNPKSKATLLQTVITEAGAYTKDRVKLLIAKGVDLNKVGRAGAPPVINATTMFARYDVALMMLEAGADPNVYIEGQNTKLVHIVYRQKDRLGLTPELKADYDKLVQWLKDHGQSFEEAEADYQRWAKWVIFPPEKRRELREKEIAERKAREKQAQEDTKSAP